MFYLILLVFGLLLLVKHAIVEKQEPMANYSWSSGYRKRPIQVMWYWPYWFG